MSHRPWPGSGSLRRRFGIGIQPALHQLDQIRRRPVRVGGGLQALLGPQDEFGDPHQFLNPEDAAEPFGFVCIVNAERDRPQAADGAGACFICE